MRSALVLLLAALPLSAADWPQFAHDPQHGGQVDRVAQPLAHKLADIVYDPFVPQEIADGDGDLLVHYQTPLVDGDDVFMEFKSGSYAVQTWSIHRLHWNRGVLADLWTAPTDWKPAPASANNSWEQLFHAILANGALYEPGAGGTVLQFDRGSGALVRRINPFGTTIDGATFVASPLVADPAGNLYYTALRLASGPSWNGDARGAWLVRIAPDATTALVPYSSIVTGAPSATAQCTGIFDLNQSPLPPSPAAVPPSVTCGSQRPGLNAAPAIAPDGTIYVMSRAHFNSYWSYLVAVNADLTPKWTASLRNRLHDGCGVLLPAGFCRAGTTLGVAPEENAPGSGRVLDISTSSPVVAPDGTVLYGAHTLYNDDQGHLMRFDDAGNYLGAYQFGWDITPAIYTHGGGYSIVLKENHYGGAVHPVQAYYITQLSPSLDVEWQSETNVEFCVNAPAVDANGTVYVNNEDGFLYAIAQGGAIQQRIFLFTGLGAAYTPLSIGADGRIYAQNAGHLYAIGAERPHAVRH